MAEVFYEIFFVFSYMNEFFMFVFPTYSNILLILISIVRIIIMVFVRRTTYDEKRLALLYGKWGNCK